ncbi:MAG: class I SAM-dependent methyltransferase [Thiotrichales bacterium]
MNVELEDQPCPNDCRRDDETLFIARDRLHGLPGDFPVVRCRTCGLIRTNPRPTPATMGFYYPDDYGPYVATQPRSSAIVKQSPYLRPLHAAYRRLVRFRSTALPELPPGRMLEIGCASGAFMNEMSARGWQVEGVEFSPTAAAAARAAGHKVHTGALESAPDPEESFDLIVGWMVLEHLHDPLGALKRLGSWARPGAWLALSVPNAAAAEFRRFKSAGFALHVPNHLYHFTPETLAALLARSGWRVERILHQRVLTSLWGGIGNALENRAAPRMLTHLFKHRLVNSTAANIALYPLAALVAAFGETGRMTVWARRVDDR